MNLESFSFLDWIFSFLLGLGDSDFPCISRASKVFLILINRYLNIEEGHTAT
jgi:hypothetical protein